MANKEGAQLDTLPIQAYGLDGSVIRKIAVDADGKLKISGGGGGDSSIDGGFANSVYLIAQVINGGGS